MQELYIKRKDLAEVDLRFSFKPGDAIIVRSALPGKFKPRSYGPYTFTKYVWDNHLAAEVLGKDGQVRREALANLRPYYGQQPTRSK